MAVDKTADALRKLKGRGYYLKQIVKTGFRDKTVLKISIAEMTCLCADPLINQAYIGILGLLISLAEFIIAFIAFLGKKASENKNAHPVCQQDGRCLSSL